MKAIKTITKMSQTFILEKVILSAEVARKDIYIFGTQKGERNGLHKGANAVNDRNLGTERTRTDHKSIEVISI